eukprot:COSAG05_NODE_9605_length_612_cov_1.309942_1_plen_168_part_01
MAGGASGQGHDDGRVSRAHRGPFQRAGLRRPDVPGQLAEEVDGDVRPTSHEGTTSHLSHLALRILPFGFTGIDRRKFHFVTGSRGLSMRILVQAVKTLKHVPGNRSKLEEDDAISVWTGLSWASQFEYIMLQSSDMLVVKDIFYNLEAAHQERSRACGVAAISGYTSN